MSLLYKTIPVPQRDRSSGDQLADVNADLERALNQGGGRVVAVVPLSASNWVGLIVVKEHE